MVQNSLAFVLVLGATVMLLTEPHGAVRTRFPKCGRSCYRLDISLVLDAIYDKIVVDQNGKICHKNL